MAKVGIIGAGPAGIFAAINIKNSNNEVYLFDKNDKIGRKLLLTGNGRCNITSGKVYDDFLDHIIRNKDFLYSSFSTFDNFAMIDFLNRNKIETLIEEDDKVFPKSMKASDIVNLFEELIRKKQVKFLANTKVFSVNKDGRFNLETSKGQMEFDILVIACGGLSYPKTGSSGDGYKFAKSFGHTLIEPLPSLCPLYLKKTLPIKALSLSDIEIRAYTDDKVFSEVGDILLTPNFITGPAALRLQARGARSRITKISIDFKRNIDDLDRILINYLDKNPKKAIGNSLKGFLTESLIETLLDEVPISKNKPSNQITKEERKKLASLIKNFTLETRKNINFNSAVVTSGGVKTTEINPKTMESKLVEDLYFVGEVIDIDGLTGGFNLQIAFTTAYSASLAIKEKL
ncbi:aminoacetone oxidase family FAD-binding enzyme [Anaerococcus sp. AGMB09787]|uniref:NAD(P)/FAD-dependent oxidoreductase n=1 Tax=Anaerococcus sp. AGMB09787 TaxID=2922869 RepID=UPI001FAFED04|nr:aminoacetone oxidase family FAD-binding enzyme [Anaerococcus sp. AGMB09787]